jgi:hypothetical protein
MAWSVIWPVGRHDAARTALGAELRAALEERVGVSPGGELPGLFERHGPLRSTTGPWYLGNLSGLQAEIAAMLTADNAWRWWDRPRTSLYDLPTLLGDAIGRATWSRALPVPGGAAVPAEAVIFNELRAAARQLRCVRRVSYSSVVRRVGSAFHLTWNGASFAAERADAFAQMQGQDDGVTTGLVHDVGLSALVFDSLFDRMWYLESREVELRFDTTALAGRTVAAAWLEISVTAAPGGTDFSDSFPIEVRGQGGAVRGSFNSSAVGVQQVALMPVDVDAGGEAVLVLGSGRSDAADRPAWSAGGFDWSSTYREGAMVGNVVRLVVEVQFEYA